MSNIFFKPDPEMVEWLIKYADNRLVIDVGCGDHFHLTKCLVSKGCKSIVAIDNSIIDLTGAMMFKLKHVDKSIHILPSDIKTCSHLYNKNHPNLGTLLIFARPCHSDFVFETIDEMGEGVEALYITVPENLELYNDLGKYKDIAVKIEHEGTSEDKEVVYSIKK